MNTHLFLLESRVDVAGPVFMFTVADVTSSNTSVTRFGGMDAVKDDGSSDRHKLGHALVLIYAEANTPGQICFGDPRKSDY